MSSAKVTSDEKDTQVLVDTGWVQEHLTTPGIRLVEVDVDTRAYDAGHLPGAVGFNWETQLQDRVRRDIIGREGLTIGKRHAFAQLISDGQAVVADAP